MKTTCVDTDIQTTSNREPGRAWDQKVSARPNSASEVARQRSMLVVVALLCLFGLAISAELTRIHLFVHTDPSYHSVCAVSEGLNCETVAESPCSVYFGLPVSVWGIIAYLTIGLLALSALVQQRLHSTWPWGILLLLSLSCLAVSAALAYISVTQIGSLCLFCMASYLVNAMLLAACVVGIKKTQTTVGELIESDFSAILRRPQLAGALMFSGLALIGGTKALVPPYWATPGWSDLPKLTTGTDDQGHHWLGACNPVLTIVEFSDYECPHCRAAHKQMRKLAAEYRDQIRLLHRHLPLDMACNPGLKKPFHTRACLFAEAAECAGLQGRFWDMNDALFSSQETRKAVDLDPVELGVRIGLNRTEFKACLESHETSDKVAVDIREALARTLKGTPSFLIGEQVYVGNVPEPELLRHLQNHSTSPSSEGASLPTQTNVCDGSRSTGGNSNVSR